MNKDPFRENQPLKSEYSDASIDKELRETIQELINLSFMVLWRRTIMDHYALDILSRYADWQNMNLSNVHRSMLLVLENKDKDES